MCFSILSIDSSFYMVSFLSTWNIWLFLMIQFCRQHILSHVIYLKMSLFHPHLFKKNQYIWNTEQTCLLSLSLSSCHLVSIVLFLPLPFGLHCVWCGVKPSFITSFLSALRHLSLASFRIIPLSLDSSSLTMRCLGVDFFVFIQLVDPWVSWVSKFRWFFKSNLGNLGQHFFKFCLLLTLSFSWFLITYIPDRLICSVGYQGCVNFSSILFLCVLWLDSYFIFHFLIVQKLCSVGRRMQKRRKMGSSRKKTGFTVNKSIVKGRKKRKQVQMKINFRTLSLWELRTLFNSFWFLSEKWSILSTGSKREAKVYIRW